MMGCAIAGRALCGNDDEPPADAPNCCAFLGPDRRSGATLPLEQRADFGSDATRRAEISVAPG